MTYFVGLIIMLGIRYMGYDKVCVVNLAHVKCYAIGTNALLGIIVIMDKYFFFDNLSQP